MTALLDGVLAVWLIAALWCVRTGRMRLAAWPNIVFLLLLLVYSGATSVTRVSPGQRAVVRRFGRILPDAPGPGLYVGVPWGVDAVALINVSEVRQVLVGYTGKDDEENDTPAGQLLTGDHNLVNVQAKVQYRVREDEVDRFFLNAERAGTLVGRAGESVLAEWIAARSVDEVLLVGKAELPSAMRELVQQRVEAYRIGVQIEGVSIPHLNPPEQVKSAFDDVAQEQTKIATRKYEAELKANRKRRQAESEAFALQSEARAYAQRQGREAEGEVETFMKRLTQYRQYSRGNPDYLKVVWLDEMTRLFTSMKASGRVGILDHFLAGDGLNITEFPFAPKK
jgi:membrane protease subunit HflK